MSATNDGGPAFPINDTTYPNGQVQLGSTGMTLRDYFAAHAMAALVSDKQCEGNLDDVATDAYILADKMIERREGGAK